MKISVLGPGQAGSAVGRKLSEMGHDVMMGSRAPKSEKLRDLAASAGVKIGTHSEAAAHGAWIVNALPGESAVGILRDCEIDGKILLDLANYNSAVDQPIEVPVGEAIQLAFPKVRLVKTLNSVSAHLMVDPKSLGAAHHVFVAGNDPAARDEVKELLRAMGWEHILDLGDLSACRAMEQLLPLWMRLEQVLEGPDFNLRVASPKLRNDAASKQ